LIQLLPWAALVLSLGQGGVHGSEGCGGELLSDLAQVGDPQPQASLLTLEPGVARARELAKHLAQLEGDELQAHLVVAFEEFMLQSRAFRLDLACPLAEAMHASAGATWSAMSLALVSTRAGDSARARTVLGEQLDRTPEGVEQYELLERLGLAILGAGDERQALAPLGSALARGSANAGVVLGRLALEEGRLAQARTLFRCLLREQPPQSWALRGWGLSMIPPRDGLPGSPAQRQHPSGAPHSSSSTARSSPPL
jgi:hypothetical protein